MDLKNKIVKDVDIVFENCEFYKVPINGIYQLDISELSQSFLVHPNGLDKFCKPGESMQFISSNYVNIILNEEGMNVKSNLAETFNDEQRLKDRVKYNDITHLDINFTDGTNIYVGVPWEDGKSEYDNKYQHNEFRDKSLLIEISEDYDKDELKELSDDINNRIHYNKEHENDTSEDIKFQFSESIKKIKNIESTIIEDREPFEYGVPNYVQAAFSKIDEQLSRVMWNINQEEYDSPFSNSGDEFKNDTFEVISYDWNNEDNQPYNFKWKDYKVRWYKHCLRGLEANREISPEECAIMLNECLQSIYQMDMDDDDLFPEEDENKHYCVQCGKETNYKELQNSKWACENCLNKLGKEQISLKDELENILFGFGFELTYEEMTDLIDSFIDFLKFSRDNSTIETLEHLIKSLEAINISIKLENNIDLDEEITKKLEEAIKNW